MIVDHSAALTMPDRPWSNVAMTMDTGEHIAIVIPLGPPWSSNREPELTRFDCGVTFSHAGHYGFGTEPDSGMIDWDADEPPGPNWRALDTRTGELVIDDD